MFHTIGTLRTRFTPVVPPCFNHGKIRDPHQLILLAEDTDFLCYGRTRTATYAEAILSTIWRTT